MATKRCYSCDKIKDVAEFPINRKRGDGLGTLCKACKKVYNLLYYERTKERHNPARAERRRRAVAEAQRQVYEYLQSHPCVDCGETDIVVLDFDHQGDKVAEINVMIDAGLAWHRFSRRSPSVKSFALTTTGVGLPDNLAGDVLPFRRR